ncbi:MAG: CBS domain-containing protein [Desulfocapsaceae bacterium]|nr:CBS domain-containing protein [Desulfocapsaceae bacterium]
MLVITTHLNADFDGMASMIAAQKLYPGAVLAFPGSQEKGLRDFISQSLLYSYDFQKTKNIDPAKVDQLVVVDTRSSVRIGPFAACLKNPGLSLHIYDHHPGAAGDMEGDVQVVDNVGATVTILTQILKERQISVNADEATIFCLGIYEDTGSLTHLTTTPADLKAAAWLLEQGARLDIVSQFITYELTTLQVELLHDLMKTAQTYTIQGIPIIVVSLTLPDYIDDFSLIIRRFMNMENLDTLFALVSMAGRIYLIARSRIPEVNVGTIARDLGGGGHSTAASATIQNMTMIEAQEKLIQVLHRHIFPQPIAREMMSQPAITISVDTSIHQANLTLTRYNITSIPVLPLPSDTKDATVPLVAGIITRMVIEKAIHHNLGHLPVGEYMTSDIEVLSLNATLSDIQDVIIEHRQRLIPIVHERELKGVITRTDLLNRLVNDPSHLPKNMIHESEQPSLARTRNINTLIVECLSKKIITLLRTIGEVADSLQFNAFAVGGFVRDLLLKKSNLDLDVVIEGDGIVFAKRLAEVLQGRVKTHERFATAMVLMPDGFKIDVATARLEYYEYPAALPTVELSSIKLDLYRRDFTINAMAIHLNPASFGTLNDFFNCQNDLKHRAIKVLHNLSFVEDPTRIFRAIRLEKRMDFQIVEHTRRLIRSAVKMQLFGKDSDPRFLTELQIILSEENPLPAIQRLAEFDLFQFLWPDLKPNLKIDRRFMHILTQAYRALSWFRLLYLKDRCEAWMVYLLAIMGRSTSTELLAFCKRFNLPDKTMGTLLGQKENAEKIAGLMMRRRAMRNSEIFRLLISLDNEGLLYLMAIARKNDIKMAVSLYVTSLSRIRPLLSGQRLKDMGYRPGPAFTSMLNDLLDARLDGLVQSEAEEEALIRRNYPL